LRFAFISPVLLITASIAAAVPSSPAKLDPRGVAFFEQKIRPVLIEHCYKCHSAEAKGNNKLKGGLLLDTRDATLRGGDTGPSIVPGNVSRSLLIAAIEYKSVDLEMPPKTKLPAAVIADFVKWVEMGAPDPRESTAPGPGAAASAASASDLERVKREHWAYQPLKSPAIPQIKNKTWPQSPIDTFILHKLEPANISPAPPADPLTLLRRVYIDLIGLPPTPAEQDEFMQKSVAWHGQAAARSGLPVANHPGGPHGQTAQGGGLPVPPTQSPDPYESTVDRLLASPRYGERWARHWLDVVRYAETKGYERDDNKPNTWRYRDWAIDAFNIDMPYDRFIAEQLAGDELEDATVSTRIATTYLALGPFDTIANDGNRARYDQLDDILGTTAVAFLGQTLSCARCHDHKFEPLSQADYYRLLAAFEPLKNSDLEGSKEGRAVGTVADRAATQKEIAEIDRQYAATRSAIDAVQLPLLERLEKEGAPKGKAKKLEPRHFARVLPVLRTPVEKRSKEQSDQLAKDAQKIQEALNDFASKEELAALKKLRDELTALDAKRPKPVMAWAPEERGPKPGATRILIRGEAGKPGAEVAFGLPMVLHSPKLDAPTPTASSSGRRLWLARWMVNEGKALTARVMVNRIWQYHFGEGFMADANDFGVKAGGPSHPELLEWLAHDFVQGGWKLKRLHKQIVMSSTYRQSSDRPDDPSATPNAELRTPNFSIFPRHRMEAEAIRDSILAVSGKLNVKMHGPSIFPPFENKVVGDSSGVGWGQSDEGEASRRSVYVYQKRAIPLPELFLLGLPDASVSCGKRAVSTTPVQSLLLLNGKFADGHAKEAAARIREDASEDRMRQVRLAFQLVLCRPPGEREQEMALAFLAGGEGTKETIDPLASLCLVLMNTNEFVYRN